MKNKWTMAGLLSAGLLLILAVGLSQAQGPEPPMEGVQPQGAVSMAAAVSNKIPIQGRLTDASGNPLNGNYNITASIYNVSSGGTALCSKTQNVSVSNGLFDMTIDNCTSDHINGQQLYLGIQVGSDAEMTPRQAIYPVPYAFSLLPGATISYAPLMWSGTLVDLQGNLGNNISWWLGYSYPLIPLGRANYGVSAQASGGDRVYGVSGSAETSTANAKAYGLYGSADATGTGAAAYGVYGHSENGIAIKAGGTGIIQSTARSYLWISGNALQKADSNDATRLAYDVYGGYKVYGGSTWGTNKTVLLPITIPGQLYGQNVTVTGLDIYCKASDEFTSLALVRMRRQNGVNNGDLILSDSTYRCNSLTPEVEHWDLTQNNVLSDQQGVLYLAFQVIWGSETSYVQIGGVRLTLEHD